MQRRVLALLCALLLFAPPVLAVDAPEVPYVLELRGMGIAIDFNEDWRELIAQGQINFLLGYTMNAQEQMVDTVTLDIYFWPEPRTVSLEEVEALKWEEAGAMRLASIHGSRRDAQAADAAPTPKVSADASEPQPECLVLPDGGDYAYTLIIYPMAPTQTDTLDENLTLLIEQLREPDALIRTFAPEPLG